MATPLPWQLTAQLWLDRHSPLTAADIEQSLDRWARSREQPGALILPSEISQHLLRCGVRRRQLLQPAHPIGGQPDQQPHCTDITLTLHRL